MLVPTGQQGCHIASRAAYNKLCMLWCLVCSQMLTQRHLQPRYNSYKCNVFSSVCSQNASTFEAPAFLQPCPRAGKPGGTKQKLNWGYSVPLGMVYNDTWVCSRLRQLNIHPHFPSAPFPFLSHAHPHGAWALLSAWLTVSVMDCHLPGLWVCSPLMHSPSTVSG